MLVIEHTANGRTMVTLKKDWHPGRMGTQYTPPRRNYVTGESAERVQRALLNKPVASLTSWWVGK
jgi:hypothetical protein